MVGAFIPQTWAHATNQGSPSPWSWLLKHRAACHCSYCTTPGVSSSEIRCNVTLFSPTNTHPLPHHLHLSTLSHLQQGLRGASGRLLENHLFPGAKPLPGHPQSGETRTGSFVTDLQKAILLKSFIRAPGSKDLFFILRAH